MSTPHTIPLAILVRAAAALKNAKDSPSGQSLSVPIWHAVMVSHSELSHHLEILLRDQKVVITETING